MNAVAVRHVLFEDLGLIEPLLVRRGFEVSYLEAGIDPLEEAMVEAELLIVLGGPIGVGDSGSYPFLEEEIAALRQRLDEKRPTLGICLGAQLMASALGAGVDPTGRTEIGFSELTFTQEGLASPLAALQGVPVFHWHGDEFQIPEGCDRLASTEGFPNQAFSRGPELLALQFHIETDLAYLERWLIGHSGELAAAGINPQALRDQAAACREELRSAAGRVISDWLDGI